MHHKMMKKTILFALTILTFSCSTTVKIEKTENECILKTKYRKAEGIILTKDYIYLFTHDRLANGFTPSATEIETAEKILKEKIREVNKSRPNQLDGSPIIHRNLYKYFRQYSGNINENGEKIININMLWDRFSIIDRIQGCNDNRPDYRLDYITMFDGGSYYWSISINISNSKIEFFSVKGLG
jgi:hypothetical protein